MQLKWRERQWSEHVREVTKYRFGKSLGNHPLFHPPKCLGGIEYHRSKCTGSLTAPSALRLSSAVAHRSWRQLPNRARQLSLGPVGGHNWIFCSSSFLLLVAMPFVTSSFLLLVVSERRAKEAERALLGVSSDWYSTPKALVPTQISQNSLLDTCGISLVVGKIDQLLSRW